MDRGIDVLKQRRRKLTALEEAFDAGVAHERQRAMRALLRQPLITVEHEAYRVVRAHGEWLRTWFAHHVDWQLSITSEAARLRKTPAGLEDASRPCRDPKSSTTLTRRGYVYLCLLIAALVRLDWQTTLGTLAEQLGGHLRSDPVFEDQGMRAALDTPGDRRELVDAIRVLLSWNVLVRVQGHEESFMRDQAADVLYSVNRPILSRLLAATTAPHSLPLNPSRNVSPPPTPARWARARKAVTAAGEPISSGASLMTLFSTTTPSMTRNAPTWTGNGLHPIRDRARHWSGPRGASRGHRHG